MEVYRGLYLVGDCDLLEVFNLCDCFGWFGLKEIREILRIDPKTDGLWDKGCYLTLFWVGSFVIDY